MRRADLVFTATLATLAAASAAAVSAAAASTASTYAHQIRGELRFAQRLDRFDRRDKLIEPSGDDVSPRQFGAGFRSVRHVAADGNGAADRNGRQLALQRRVAEWAWEPRHIGSYVPGGR